MKLKLWKEKVEIGDLYSFPQLQSVLPEAYIYDFQVIKKLISPHLNSLEEKFNKYNPKEEFTKLEDMH